MKLLIFKFGKKVAYRYNEINVNDYGNDMFSTIGHFISPQKTRETEKTDTHEYIRQHQRDNNGKKNQKKSTDSLFSTDDQTEVSIDALYTFLENFLSEQINNSKEPQTKNFLDNMETMTEIKRPTVEKPKNPAIHAYQHAAETSPDRQKAARQPRKAINESDLVGNQDIQAMYALMKDVGVLKDNNIETLSIERGATFLESLRVSVDNAMAHTSR